ncbi:MAG TPA: stage II sporulation protein M [Candidatus Sulfotelmatobacter sp.]|nr:stage II sporulation protein M [Candidatus Sulfotelmatobacter sp.]
MISTRWLEKRKPHWSKLESLLNQSARDGLKSLSRSDLQELSLLYRQTAADLAAIREDRGSIHFARYVNQLLVRAHNTIYSGHRASPLAALSFFWDTYPAVFRRLWRHCLLAVLVFAIAGLVGAALTYQNPDFKVKLLGPQMVETIDRHQMWTHSIVGIKPLASSAIMTNNMSVGFTTFALGITAGLGTLYMMAFNGLLIGVIGMACFLSGMSLQLWSFVAPHGVLELPAIFIAGGAGFRIAQGLLFPGVLPRRDSLTKAGLEAVQLILGTIPILIIAGLIEAFVSPTGLPIALKFSMAAALFVLLNVYLFGVGRSKQNDAAKL